MRLEEVLANNPVVVAILERASELGFPDWYLGAGGVAQTVWNATCGFAPTAGIKDYDLVYFDSTDLSVALEEDRAGAAVELFTDLDVTIDVTNEARVHLWYGDRYGFDISPYRSTEHAIATWPTTATSVGVRHEADKFVVCAPFGLDDLFSLVVRPNKTLIREDVYLAKVRRWLTYWPQLTVIPWDAADNEVAGP